MVPDLPQCEVLLQLVPVTKWVIYPVGLFQLATLGAFTCALALTNQHTVVVYVACIAFWVLYHLWRAQVGT